MRKTTKIISLLLTLAMMLTMVLPMTVSAAFSDVPASHHYYNAITNLSAEGILNGFEDGTFKPEEPVTRAQFTKIICYALSVGNLTYSTEEKSIFTDLAPEHWAADNIVTAYKQGIINGMGDGTFAPEAGVQYEQAVKMVVCALGYGNRALSLGEYPVGYMTMASQLKLLKGITDAKMYEVMSRGAVAQLIDNMLDTDQNIGGEQGGSIRDEVSTSKKVEGKVLAGYGVALYTGDDLDKCRKNEIIIETNEGNVAYDVSEIKNFDIYEFLGRSVTVYYEEESGVSAQVLSSIALQARKNETTKIELDMIYDYDDSTIEYYTDADRTETETVTYQGNDTNVLWNGQPTSYNVQTLLDSYGAKSGYITLVSSEANQSADVAFLKTYETIVVDVVDKKNYKISAKNVINSYVLDVTDRNKNITITMNGNDYPFSSIKTNDILSISESADKKVIEVLVSTKVVTGKITSMLTEPQTQIKLNTGNTIYTVSPEVYDAETNNSGSTAIAALQAGQYLTISLDAFGKVARFIVSAESSYSYGYISALEHGTSTKPVIKVMIYKPATSNMSLEGKIYQFAERVKIDAEGNMKVEDEMLDILDYLRGSAIEANKNLHTDFAKEDKDPLDDDEATDYAQPVRFALNSVGEIEAILTVESGDPTTTSSTELEIVDKTADGIECTVDGAKFEQYGISSSTPVLYIPTDRSLSSYSSKSNGFFDQGYKYFVQFANVSATNTVGCVYLYGVQDSEGNSSDVTAKITEENKPLIILEKSQKTHLGNTETCIKVMDVTTGNTEEYYENSLDLDTLSIGDVVLLAIGTDKYVDDLFVLADADAVADGSFTYEGGVYEKIYGNTSGVNADFRALIAKVTVKEGNSFVVKSDNSKPTETFNVTESLPMYIVDENANETNKVSSASMIDVVEDARVLVYTVKGNAEAVIIFAPKTTNN